MKLNQIYSILIKKIIIFSLAFLILLSIASAGQLKHTIYDPYGNIVESSVGSYPSSGQSNTIIEDKYKTFDYNAQNSYFDSEEPYCKFGGQYNINVYNNPDYAGVYDRTTKLYYCKTTQDLIKKIKIPQSWANKDLILYCNDGSNIYDPEFNIDFLTSKVNTYKLCILKNLDLESENTIIYGFEAGNKLIDSYSSNYFNPTTKSGAIVNGLNHNSLSNSSALQINKRIYFYVPYVTICAEEKEEIYYEFSMTPIISCSKPDVSTAMQNSYPTRFNSAVQTLDNYVLTRYPTAIIGTLQTEGNFGSASHTYHSVVIQINISQNTYFYENSLINKTYMFEYEPFNRFYVLREVSSEKLTKPINTIFTPQDIGLSRVALFRKVDNKKIYGYETAIKTEALGNEIRPVYKIQGLGSLNFTKGICQKTLAMYNPTNDISKRTDEVACKAGGEIEINSLALDKKYDQRTQQGWSLNLFKNIILGIK